MLEVFFCGSLALIVYVYAGYPACLLLCSWCTPSAPKHQAQRPPATTLIVSAYNEEGCIAEKLDNSLAIDYPPELLEILVVSDASIDATDSIVADHAAKGIRLLRMPERCGKTLGLNAAVEQARGEVLVFSDANAMYRPDAIRALVRHFADPGVGAVIGESGYTEAESDAGRSESLYWSYETTIKRLESSCGSVVGGDGAIYAVKKTLYRPMSADALSDFVNPLQVVRAGYRCVYEPGAVSWEQTAGNFDREFRRKVRIVNRAWRALMGMKALLNPFQYGRFTWQLVSHKLLRWLVPAFMLTAFMTNAFLVGEHALYLITFALQILVYGLAITGAWLRNASGLSTIFYIPYYFCLVNVASAVGIIDAYRGKTYAIWSTARADK